MALTETPEPIVGAPEQEAIRLPETEPSVMQAVQEAPAPEPEPSYQVVENGVVLALTEPWNVAVFKAGIEGVPPITRNGTVVPAPLAEQIITSAARSGLTVEQRS